MNYERRRAALGDTVARMNEERAALGLGPGYAVGTAADGMPHLALVGEDKPKPKTERIRPPPVPARSVRVRL